MSRRLVSLPILLLVTLCTVPWIRADWNYFVPPTGIVSITVGDIVQDNAGRTWFATGVHKGAPGSGYHFAGSGISVFDHRSWITYSTSNGLPSNDVNALAVDAAGRVWAATENGIARYQAGSWSVVPVSVPVRAVAVDLDGSTVWFGTDGAGVLRYNGVWTEFDTGNSSIPSDFITSVAVAPNGRKYFGTDGAFVAELSGSTWSQLVPSPGYPSTIWSVMVDSSGAVWCGSNGQGVYRRSAGSSSWSHWGTAEGLGSGYVVDIAEDADGAVWFVFGLHGNDSAVISKFLDGLITSYPRSAGYPSSNMVALDFDDFQNSEAQHQYWFGTITNGAARYGAPYSLANWPQDLPYSSSTSYVRHSSPALADIDLDGKDEIIVASLSGYVYVYNDDGSLLWAARSYAQSSINSSPAVGDLNNDGLPEIVIGYGTGYPGHEYEQGGFVCFSNTGARLWEKGTIDVNGDGLREGVFATPAIGDIDGDGYKDVVVGAWDQRIYAFRYDGEPVIRVDNDGDGRVDEDPLGDATPAPHNGDGCPGICGVDDDRDGRVDEGHFADDDEDGLVEEDDTEWPRSNQDSVWSSAALGDLQGDGDLEVVVGGDSSPGGDFAPGGTLRVLNADGSPENRSWPKGLPQVVWSSPALADLDNDGRLEVIVGNGHFYTGVSSRIYVFRSDGSGYLSDDGTFAILPEYVFGSPAVGDIDGDGQPEVVVGCLDGKVYAWDGNGAALPGWPVEPNPYTPSLDILSSPVIGDVDGDGIQDVVIGVSGVVFALNGAGHVIPGWGTGEGTSLSYTIGNSPAIGDINNDGLVDVVVANAYSMNGGATISGARIYVWSGGTYSSPAWPMFRKDARRTGLSAPVPRDTSGGYVGVEVLSDSLIISEKAEYTEGWAGSEMIYNAFGTNAGGVDAPSTEWYFADADTRRFQVELSLLNPSEKSSASVEVTYLEQGSVVRVEEMTLLPTSKERLLINDSPSLDHRDLAVVITSDVGIVAEKNFWWSGTVQGQTVSRLGGAGSVGSAKALNVWYLAEGSTAGWKLYYYLLNPSPSVSASVSLDYVVEGVGIVTANVTLPPYGKKTIYVNDVLPFANVSLRAMSDEPIVVERTMQWDASQNGELVENVGGHNSTGIEEPKTLWYLAEGSTAGWRLWVLLMNPNSQSATATVTWMREGKSPLVENYTLPPTSRTTLGANWIPGLEFENVSVKVEASRPIIVERSMYWDTNLSGGLLYNSDGHNSPGVNDFSSSWYLAGGSTIGDYRTWVLLMNPNSSSASAVLRLMTEDGRVIVRRFDVPANSRKTVLLNTIYGAW